MTTSNIQFEIRKTPILNRQQSACAYQVLISKQKWLYAIDNKQNTNFKVTNACTQLRISNMHI